MNYLLDTHVLIWYLEGDKLLSKKARKIIEDTSNNIFVSHASFFEIVIKLTIGKISTNYQITDYLENTKKSLIEILPIEEAHLIKYEKLELFDNHKDPFDRLIISTAIQEKLSIISIDSKFDLYSETVEIVW